MTSTILNPFNRVKLDLLTSGFPTSLANDVVLIRRSADSTNIQCTLSDLIDAIKATVVDGVRMTGEMVDYCGTVAPAGWILANGKTIGTDLSGATGLASVTAMALFDLLWTNFSNTELPIQTSAGAPTVRGVSGINDFMSNKRLPLPDLRGRVRATLDNLGGSAASVLTAPYIAGTTLGAIGGTQAVALLEADIAAHTHEFTDTNTTYSGTGANNAAAGTDIYAGLGTVTAGSTTDDTSSTGTGAEHANVQPTFMVGTIIKL